MTAVERKSPQIVEMNWDPITRIIGNLGVYTKIDFANRVVTDSREVSPHAGPRPANPPPASHMVGRSEEDGQKRTVANAPAGRKPQCAYARRAGSL